MKLKFAALALIFLNAGVAVSSAMEISSDTIDLRQILEAARRDNPEILAASKFWEAAKKRTTQATGLKSPRLDLERMHAPKDQSVTGGAQEKNWAVSQEIPFPSTLILRRGVAAKGAAMAHEAYRAKVREVLARARSTYAMLYLAHKSLEIFGENIELMRRFTKIAQSKYAAGHAGQSDALKAQVELTKMLNMSVMFNQEKEIAQAMLNALLNREADKPLGKPVDPESKKLERTFDDLKTVALARRPQLKEAFFALQRASKSLSLARSEFLPNLMLGYRQRRDAMSGPSRDAMFGFTVPLWFWGPAAMAQEARAEKEMAEAQYQAMRVMTEAELKSALVKAQTVERLIEIYQTSVIPQAEFALKVAEAGYQADKSNFLDLLDAQRSLLNFRLEYYQYIASYQERLAELERVVGRDLDDLGGSDEKE